MGTAKGLEGFGVASVTVPTSQARAACCRQTRFSARPKVGDEQGSRSGRKRTIK